MLNDDEPSVSSLAREDFKWTERQRQVLDRLTRGWSNQQIADDLGISLDGAKWHLREILSTLGVESREAAAEYWRRRNGLPSRFARVFRAGFPTPLRLATATTSVGVAVAAIVIIVAAQRSANGDEVQGPGQSLPSPAGVPTVEATFAGLIGFEAAIAQAVEDGDWDRLVSYIEPEFIPCDSSDLSASPSCPVQVAAATPVEAVVRFQCRPVWVSVASLMDPSTSRLPAQYRFRGTVRGEPLPGEPVGNLTSFSHWLVFTTSDPSAPPGFAVAVSASGVRAFGASCASDASSFWSNLP